jgi:putative membrane protein
MQLSGNVKLAQTASTIVEKLKKHFDSMQWVEEVEEMGLKRKCFSMMVLPLSFFACTRGPYDSPMGRWGHMMGYWYGGGLMWLIILALIGVGIYFLIQASKSKSSDNSTMETPLDILKKRYARGEIDKEEFEQKKKDLES